MFEKIKEFVGFREKDVHKLADELVELGKVAVRFKLKDQNVEDCKRKLLIRHDFGEVVRCP